MESAFNILFWNLAKHDLSSLAINLINESNVDVAIFCEHNNLNKAIIKENLLNFKFYEGFSNDSRILVLIKKELDISGFQDKKHYTIFKIDFTDFSINIVGTHLLSKLHEQDTSRRIIITDMLQDLSTYENENNKSIIIGDFNLAPYDSQMLDVDLFNSVIFEELIEKEEFSKAYGHEFRRFYNPFLRTVSENEKKYGSYYYNKQNTTYWFMYDQCLIRKDLIPLFKNIEIVKRINDIELLEENKPNGDISDHLPILVTIEGGKSNE